MWRLGAPPAGTSVQSWNQQLSTQPPHLHRARGRQMRLTILVLSRSSRVPPYLGWVAGERLKERRAWRKSSQQNVFASICAEFHPWESKQHESYSTCKEFRQPLATSAWSCIIPTEVCSSVTVEQQLTLCQHTRTAYGLIWLPFNSLNPSASILTARSSRLGDFPSWHQLAVKPKSLSGCCSRSLHERWRGEKASQRWKLVEDLPTVASGKQHCRGMGSLLSGTRGRRRQCGKSYVQMWSRRVYRPGLTWQLLWNERGARARGEGRNGHGWANRRQTILPQALGSTGKAECEMEAKLWALSRTRAELSSKKGIKGCQKPPICTDDKWACRRI